MTEIWKDIQGYEGFYQISNLGNVKSLLKMANIKNMKIYLINFKRTQNEMKKEYIVGIERIFS